MNNITIDGLSKAQVEMLDIMWSIDGYDEYLMWKSGLNEQTLLMVEVLESMLLLADIDEVEDCTEANQVLARFARH